jgi:hypothetical protein
LLLINSPSGGLDLVNVNERLAGVASEFVHASIGVGLYAVVVAGSSPSSAGS